jgi:DnaK suppressor protein
MPDIADLAEIREAKQRQDAIERITHRRFETPLLDILDRRICLDCEEIIPLQRIAAAPHAVRCVPCQQASELA